MVAAASATNLNNGGATETQKMETKNIENGKYLLACFDGRRYSK